MKKDNRIKYFKTKKNSGTVSIPRNLGVSKSQGEYVAFLDADDSWNPNKLTYQMEKIGNFKFSFTAADYVKNNHKKNSNFIVNITRILLQFFFMSMLNKYGFFWLYIYNPFLISSAIIKKKVFVKYKFNINKNIREDLAYWLVVFAKYKNSFIYHPRILLTITRANNSMSSNKIEEFNKIINSICQHFFSNKNYSRFGYFLAGIASRAFKLILSRMYETIRRKLKYIFIIFCLAYFLIFYSPLFWNIGNHLIYYSQQKQTEAVFVLSGHQGFNYWNDSYQLRYVDSIHYLDIYNSKKNTKFFLLGKLSAIPEQKILESLLLAEGVPQNNIFVIYDEYQNTESGLKLLKRELDRKNISSFTLITSPYHSLRLSRIGKKFFGDKYDLVFFKNVIMPLKNNYFEKSYNKKEIIYELLANFKQRFF